MATDMDMQDYMNMIEDIKDAIRPYLTDEGAERLVEQAAGAAVQSLVENGAIEFEGA